MSKRLKGLVIVCVLAVAAIFPASVSAYYVEIQPSGPSCGSWDGWPKVCLWEDGIGQGDKLIVWQNSSGQFVDLTARDHTIPGMCNATFKLGDDWNDCITSLRWYGDESGSGADWLCVYRDVGYDDLMVSTKGTWPDDPYKDITFVSGFNDAVSSFKIHRDWGTGSNPC